jgi:transcriptional regulator with XRE-family HTH domain
LYNGVFELSSVIRKKRQKNIFVIGQHLKDLRNNRQITFEELSRCLKISVASLKQYDANQFSPNLDRLIEFSNFYSVSVDFLILWDKTEYIKSIELFKLADTIDKLDQVKRFQIESTALSLIGHPKELINIRLKEDPFNLENDVNTNIRYLIDKNKMLLQTIADYLESTPGLISSYTRATIPPVDKLIKLSKLFGVSIHCIATGQKLNYKFKNESLNEAIVKADQLLSLKDKEILIHLMKRIIEDIKS